MEIIEKIQNRKAKIAIIGLGYVGLPLAAEFGKSFPTIGFDINPRRIDSLRKHVDETGFIGENELRAAEKLTFSISIDELKGCDIFIVTVPTPVDKYNTPDLSLLHAASRNVGKALGRGALVIFESTVFPGCTEEECVPLIEQGSSLKYNRDFFCGYSPERINPGDKEHTLTKIRKIVSGSTPETLDAIDALYQSILEVPTYRASSIKVAEAAKVIENCQRDINIAFVNELAKIFNIMQIDTNEVLEAAGTKWNFLKFKPGLVGGHCIGVDPYYLTHKATELGYHAEIILAGRRINDGMSKYVADQIVKLMIHHGSAKPGAKVAVLGITFKENCYDIRNSKVVDLVRELMDYGFAVEIFDPVAIDEEVRREYDLENQSELSKLQLECYDAVIMAVAHKEFETLDFSKMAKNAVLYDVKGVLPRENVSGRL